MKTIQQWREEKGLSITDIAKALNVHPIIYQRMESDPGTFDEKQAREISELLGVPIDEINFLTAGEPGRIPLIDWEKFALDNFEYKIITTFGNDFDIADAFGVDAIKDTFNRAFKEWKSDYKYLTELVLVLNWKIRQYHGKNDEYAKLYSELWETADGYACDTLEGEAADYFYQITD